MGGDHRRPDKVRLRLKASKTFPMRRIRAAARSLISGYLVHRFSLMVLQWSSAFDCHAVYRLLVTEKNLFLREKRFQGHQFKLKTNRCRFFFCKESRSLAEGASELKAHC